MSKTFKFKLELDTKIVVSDELLNDIIAQAEGKDATEFLKAVLEQSITHEGPVTFIDREVFARTLLTANLRKKVQKYVAYLIEQGQTSGTVSPVTLTEIPRE